MDYAQEGSGAAGTRNAGVTQEPGSREPALVAAELLLAGTADTVNPCTPAAELLCCVKRYRAHLAALTAACRLPGVPAVLTEIVWPDIPPSGLPGSAK